MADAAPSPGVRSGAVERVYTGLRKLLIEGAYPPGTHLREESLASQLGVSRTPVREAIRKLATEGWLDIIQNQGAFVRRWSRADIEEVLSLRAMLESHAARHAARHATVGQIAEMKAICSRALSLLPCEDPQAIAEVAALNSRFHKLILDASGQRRTAAIIANLVELPITLRYFKQLEPDDMERSIREHRALVEAFETRDPHWAAALMEAHVHGGKSLFLGRVTSLGEDDMTAEEPAGDVGSNTNSGN
ncbi:GntR family transcriptional regulator [Futiania mangrovi]|uniref:GntR family transcriptional regulator n=1 Tax=Futiania mangrovi TaxID=2959716 RepID=A0A9J6PBY3_9PROT|nr:GntR family transcriptional regulator [Futiania mangrovii]MCP1335734.1 GntR family transcriptional regulator [Futiania mangrovii]